MSRYRDENPLPISPFPDVLAPATSEPVPDITMLVLIMKRNICSMGCYSKLLPAPPPPPPPRLYL